MSDKTPKDSQSTEATTETKPKSLDIQINEALGKVDDKGKLIFAEDTDPLFKQAVISEKKARDTQSSYTKSRQELAEVTAKADLLQSKVVSNSMQLTAEQVAELEDLKDTDLDAWFDKKSEYEGLAKQNFVGSLNEEITVATKKAASDLTLVERQEALVSFQTRTGMALTDDVMANDIPPRLQNKINDMPFEDYLNEVATYLNKGKVVKQTDAGLDQVDISKLSGGSPGGTKTSSSYQII